MTWWDCQDLLPLVGTDAATDILLQGGLKGYTFRRVRDVEGPMPSGLGRGMPVRSGPGPLWEAVVGGLATIIVRAVIWPDVIPTIMPMEEELHFRRG